MSYDFRLQDPGEGIHEAEILEIVVSEGDHVEEGDNLLVAETDKAAVEIPSPVTGDVVEIKVSKGDTVRVGDVLIVFEESGGTEQEEDGDTERPQAEGTREEEESPGEDSARGEDGRDKGDVLAAPAVRGIARDVGVDLASIEGSGKDGRILEEDVRAAAGEPEERETRRARARPGEGEERARRADEVEGRRIALGSIRRATAQRMSRAWRDIPHVVHHDAIDISDLERLRRDLADEAAEEGAKLTLTAFLVKALAGTLREFPHFNARYDADAQELVLNEDVNVGVALDTDRGLLVPVLRQADTRSVLDLASELTRMSDDLGDGHAQGSILKGGTFTLTNVGSIGGTGFSPIINHPQVAIFGAARAELRQVFDGDLDAPEPRVALMLPVCIGFDHRVADGADAARFMNRVKQLLGDPGWFLLRS